MNFKHIFINENIGTIEKDNIKSELYGITIGCRSITDFKDNVLWWSCGDGQDVKMKKSEINYIKKQLEKMEV